MLKISETAAVALEHIRSSEGDAESPGVLRLSPHVNEAGQTVIRLTLVEAPQEDDQVAKRAGTQVFVAREVAERLSEAVMDVETTDAGPRLVFRPQAA